MDVAKNFAKATVANNNYDASATEIDVGVTHGSRLPTAPFNAVWWNSSDYPDPADDPSVEIVRVTDITGDTLTITRGQEGTAANDKNVAGKTYQLIAGLTAKVINEDIPITRNGATIEINSETGVLNMGDINAAGESQFIKISDPDAQVTISASSGLVLSGALALTTAVSASGPVGSVVAKVPLFDAVMDLIGYIPIYDSIG